jgi:hypothetical protein
VQQWKSDAFSPAQKRQFPPQQKWVVVDAGSWHTLNQITPQQHAHMFPKKHICKKLILQVYAVKTVGGDEPQGQCITRQRILRVVSIILHNQHRNWYSSNRSQERIKKGRQQYLLVARRAWIKSSTQNVAILPDLAFSAAPRWHPPANQ